ncbi:MAG: amino acid adenylation domain-containing protein, partial [Deltaproteobacteria bacterium]
MYLETTQINITPKNDKLRSFYDKRTVIQLIKEVSQKSPKAPALKYNDSYISYEDLDQKSDQLAQKLIDRGIKSEDKIIVMFPLSFDLIVSIYAILKAGGTYVPINVDDGKERLKFIIDDLNCRLIMGDFQSLKKIEGISNTTLMEVNEKRLTEFSINKKFPYIKENALAYIIYTSGTTGRPKGVMVEHKNLWTFVTSMREAIDVSTGDRWLQNPNLTFDMSVGTTFLSLCNGATLVLRSGDLHTILKEEEITHYNCTPGAATLVDPAQLPYLKDFAVGGEKVPDELITRFSPYCNIYDTYGPAEASINVSWTILNGLKTSHIGTTLPKVEFYVVADGKLVEMGSSGELWVAGDFVTRGYLNRPELTSEKFIKNPFGEGRIYKTGDKVRWLTPGEMEYQGRIDRQVKIRGHRLELDEIEKTINRFPRIKTTLARPLNDNLVAYVACD